ncbi:MAG: hypothetical protein FWE27_02355 [Defluviitaleaceae bacterium]|nr:hypothetical protein [Defluviitaleaceae bacterium]
MVLNRTRINDVRPPMLPFTSTCVPGMKISVRVDGTYDMCERINQMFPIGNVVNGLHYNDIADLIRQYNETITKNCHLCAINKVCALCFAQCAGENCFKLAVNACNGNIIVFLRNLAILYSIGERNPDELQKFIDVFEEPIEWLLNN